MPVCIIIPHQGLIATAGGFLIFADGQNYTDI